ncbi:hypothetical protein SAMN05443633_105301 [Chryseobacterium arachidis]|uniref:Uncharacterized protein n=1 Tax=Chryseobacterium arachidis TaxID=1416778 RepID=A0A1M5DHX0_9FLAO|nr:hypothetical protein [Chryseobacterium arachidis]SHF66593.1 hypothetical protein SAMN05443633_105301 [Chryseobacterium arachidis]
MEIAIFILSTVFFQLPFAFFQHSIRKYKRLESYNPMESLNYTVNNGQLDNMVLKIVIFISGLMIAFFPLWKAINIHWIFVVFINLIMLYLLTPFLAFAIYPKNRILNVKQLSFLTITCLVFAIMLFLIGSNLS